jgi:hypothetical protein
MTLFLVLSHQPAAAAAEQKYLARAQTTQENLVVPVVGQLLLDLQVQEIHRQLVHHKETTAGLLAHPHQIMEVEVEVVQVQLVVMDRELLAVPVDLEQHHLYLVLL